VGESKNKHVKPTTTPKKGGLNGDPKKVLDKKTLTAQRTRSLFFDLFSFDPAEKSGTCRTKENK